MNIAERPILLEGDALTRRIFAPVAYRLVRDTAVVPIVHGEALRLASYFPVVWRRRNDEVTLVVVRGLIDDARAQTAAFRPALPLLLQAYPFVLDPNAAAQDGGPKLLDDAVADAPTDIGASVTTTDGRPSYATTLRLRMLGVVERQLPATRALGRALADADLLQPWDLTFDIEGDRIGIPNLVIARQDAFETGAYSAVVGRHGAAAAELLALHRLSLFRAGLLVAAARGFVKEQREAAADQARLAAETPEPGEQPGDFAPAEHAPAIHPENEAHVPERQFGDEVR